MPNALKYLAVLVALIVPVSASAQSQAANVAGLEGYSQLAEKDQRRLDFYAEKIVTEIQATVEANQNGDATGFNKHGTAMKSTAERFLVAVEKLGLQENEANLIFHRHLITSYSGPLPAFMVTDTGPAGVKDLVALMVAPPETSQGNYVDSIRSAGGELLDQ